MIHPQPTSAIFSEREWTKKIPQKYRMDTLTLDLCPESVEFLLSDDTNPSLSAFKQFQELEAAIAALGGAVFVRLAQRTAKDCSRLDRKVTGAGQLVMLVKMSEYLTEALAEEEGKGAELVLRKYCSQFEGANDEFRVYVLEGQLVGACQKDPSFLGSLPTSNQLAAIAQCKIDLETALSADLEDSYVVDLFCSPNGKEVKVFAVEPFHLHALSLFAEEELRQQLGKEKEKGKKGKGRGVLVRVVEREEQLKDVDLSEYRPGAELKHLKNVSQWIGFMQESKAEERE